MRTMLAALTSTLLTACGGANGLNALLEAQTVIDFDVACRDRDVWFNYLANSSINVHPPRVDVCRGRTITVHFVPNVDPLANPAESQSAPGNPEPNGWLNETSMNGATLELIVPMGATVGSTYKYTLTVTGVGSIDPTFKIID